MKFNRLTILNRDGKQASGLVIWRCRCDCGNITHADTTALRRGEKKSCGCLFREYVSRKTIHGLSRRPEYNIWRNMIRRCTDWTSKSWKDYGGRGIHVIPEWLDHSQGFQRFFNTIGARPSPQYSLDRINVDGNYEPSNVRWSTRIEQLNNRRLKRLDQFTTDALEAELSRRRSQQRLS